MSPQAIFFMGALVVGALVVDAVAIIDTIESKNEKLRPVIGPLVLIALPLAAVAVDIAILLGWLPLPLNQLK